MSNPYNTMLNLNVVNWDWLNDHEQRMTDHESLDVDIESTLDDVSEATELAKLIREK
jgi:hypothetical protein